MTNFFFYGTLMHPKVLQRVVRNEHRAEPATLHGFARYKVRGQTYPAMIEQRDGVVEGIVRFDVSEADVARLDKFEGPAYERISIRPSLKTGAPIDCQTYVCRNEYRAGLTSDQWSLDWFEQHGLKPFLNNYEGWSSLE